MTTHHHLIRRNGVFQFRMRVPLDVAEAYGKSHIQESLRTKDVTEAGRRRDLVYLKYQAEFDALQVKPEIGGESSDYSIVLARLKPLVEDWMQVHLQRIAAEAEDDDVDWGLRSEWQDDAARSKADLEELRTTVPHRIGDVIGLAKHVLALDGAPTKKVPGDQLIEPRETVDVDEESVAFKRLCELAAAAMQEATRASIARLEGEHFVASEAAIPATAVDGPTLAEAMESFLSDPSRGASSEKSRVDYRMTFRVMRELIGSNSAAWEIGRPECRKVLDLLQRLPPNATKRLPGMTFQQIADAVTDRADDRMSARRVNQHLKRMNTLLRWVMTESEARMVRNPAQGLSVGSVRKFGLEPDRAGS